MARRPMRSISGPIILSSITVALSAALLVGWIYVILRNQELSKQVTGNMWLLVGGIVSFGVIITVLVLFSVFLARQIIEVRRQTTFIDSVTHELRSPLASLSLCLQTLARRELAPEKQRVLREMMLADVERLSAFVDDILNASRLGHGDRSHAVSDVQLDELVARCATNVARRHDVQEEAVRVDVPHGLVLRCDPTALELIVKNLLDNAVKYSDDSPNVTVSAREEGTTVELEFVDQGIGIPREELKRVLERFYRVSEEPVRARRGTGLGLFVVSALVRNLGGKLRIYSDGRGLGTRVQVRLPIGLRA
jgi:signal transduction histidine kinase